MINHKTYCVRPILYPVDIKFTNQATILGIMHWRHAKGKVCTLVFQGAGLILSYSILFDHRGSNSLRILRVHKELSK